MDVDVDVAECMVSQSHVFVQLLLRSCCA